MKRIILGIVLLTQIVFVCPMIAAVIINDPIENDGTWTLGPTVLQYLSAGYSLTPTAGTVIMHMNNGASSYSGTNSINYTNTLTPGVYVAYLDVGHWSDSPEVAGVGPIGLTAGGNLLATRATSTPTPASGQFETWQFIYIISTGDTNIGAPVGFQISVPTTGQGYNIGFDRLRVESYPPGSVLPSIYHAVEISWATETNKNYQLQWTASVDTTNWLNMGAVLSGTGSNTSAFDSTRFQQKKFYRILTLP